MTYKIAVIIPTIARKNELEACLHSLTKSEFRDFKVIIIDQNPTTLLEQIVNQYEKLLSITHMHVDFRGVSKARNYGVINSKSEYVFFIDDDAEVFPQTLTRAIESIESTHAEVVFGRCVDRNQKNSVIDFSQSAGYLTKKKNKGMFVESTMFSKRRLLEDFPFDETLGVGVFHGAEEAYDLILRMLQKNVPIFYDPTIKVYHPQKITNHSTDDIKRVFSYRCGFAKVCHKHRLARQYYSRLFQVIAYIPFCILFKKNKARYYIAELLGLIAGRVLP